MRRCARCLALVLLVSICGLLRSQTSQLTTIQIQFLDGKTGRPAAHKGVNIFFKDVRDAKMLETDEHGIAILSAKPDDRIFVFTNWGHSCRNLQGITIDGQYAPDDQYVLVERIIREGFVVKNACDKTQAEVVPGRIILFVRKLTFSEALKT